MTRLLCTAVAGISLAVHAQVNFLSSSTPIVGVAAAPADSVSSISTVGTTLNVNNYPSAEAPASVLDGNTGTKYLNFAKTNVGFIVTLTQNVAIVAFRVTTANDSANRDPLAVVIQGTTAADPTTAAGGATWTTIYTGNTGINTDPGRLVAGPVISFANSQSFNTYRVLVTAIRDLATANSMQVADVQLLGYTPGAAVIATQPVSRTNLVGQTGTFTIAVNGTPPHSIQWYSNNIAIVDATNTSYTTPSLTLANSGTTYKATVTNSLGGAVSANAVLTVQESPGVQSISTRGFSNKVFVVYVKPVVLASGTYTITNLSGPVSIASRAFGANQSEVVLTLTDNLVLGTLYTATVSGVTAQDNSAIPTATVTFLQGFGSLCANFNAGLPANSTITGSATNGGPTGADGILHLTDDGAASACGTFYISNLTGGTVLDRLVATWKSRVGGPLSGHADGYSFNWASDLPVACGTFTAEEGAGTGLSFDLDVYDNGAGPDTGIEIKWRGTRLAFQHIEREIGANPITKDTFVDVSVMVEPSGRATFTYDNYTITAVISNFAGITNGAFLFAARTGGETDNMWVDDLCINNFTVGPVTITQSPTNYTALENTPAFFSVAADGTFPYTYRWYTNNVFAGGATNATFTPTATAGLTNAQVYVVVSNGFSSATSAVATLTVTLNPRVLSAKPISSNTVAVVYSRAVDLNSGTYNFASGFEAFRDYGSNHSTVLVTTDTPFGLDTVGSITVQDVVSEVGALPLLINPTNLTFYFGFGRFCADFNSGIPANVALFGNAALSNSTVHLTDAIGSQSGALVVSNLNAGNVLDRFHIHYRMLLGGSSNPADGYSLSVGPDVPYGTSSEEGAGTGLILAFDNYNNGDGESPTTNAAPSIAVKWGGLFLTNYLTTLMRTETFVDVDVFMDPDGTLDLIYNGTVVFRNFPTPFRGLTNPHFVWSARTGGAVENAWVDDICINDFSPGPLFFTLQPVNTTVLEGNPATFSAAVDGTIPYAFQWYTNNVAVPNAVGTTFTIPTATEALNGLQVKVAVSNEFGVITSSNATLNVNLSPRVVSVRSRSSNEVVVTFTRPVDLNSGSYSISAGFEAFRDYGNNQSQVVVTLDTPLQQGVVYQATIQDVVSTPGGLTLLPNPTIMTFLHGFGTQCTDFSSGAPAGTLLGGVAVVTNGVLHLVDDAQTGQCSTYYISNLTSGVAVDTLVATWRSRIGGPLNGNADGFSFNWAGDLPTVCGTFSSEEGAGTGLSFTVDTYDNGAGPDNGIEIKWRGARVAFLHVERNGLGNSNYLTRDVFVDVSVSVTPSGLATFIYDGNILSTTIPNWTGITNGAFLLTARTGGQSDNVWIDDLCINGFSLGPVSISQQPASTSVTVGHSARLSVGVNGLPPYAIQWYSNNVAVAGATNTVYTTAPLGLPASGSQYKVIVSNYSGSVTSAVATITVNTNAGTLQSSLTSTNNRVTLTWGNPNALLQATTSLTPPITWTTLPNTSPFTYSTTNQTNIFFRLVEP